MIRISLIAIFAFAMFIDQNPVQAQNRRARFFQKIKQDLFGEQQPTEPKSAEQAKTRQSSQTPTLNKQNAQSQNQRYSPTQNPQRAYRSNSGPTNNQTQRTSVYRNQFNGKSNSNTSVSPTASPYRPTPKTRLTGSSKRGFGFSVSKNDQGQIVVENIQRGGNAADVGIRRGDRVVEIGGIEAATVDEFDEIAKIMSAGDQMEFKISRNGQKKTLTIQYGELPDEDATSQTVSTRSNSTSRNDSPRRYDFAPPQQSGSTQSVLNRPTSQTQGTQPIQARPVSSTQRNFSAGNEPQVRMLNQTIAKQNHQIKLLQQRIMQLQRSQRSR